MLRFITLFFAIVLVLIVGLLVTIRREGDGIYFLLSNETSWMLSSNLYYQPLTLQRERRPIIAVNNITGNFNRDWTPNNHWLESKDYLYFIVYDDRQETRCLYRTSFRGSQSEQLACQNHSHPSIDSGTFYRSNDGMWFAYSNPIAGSDESQILLVKFDGSETKVVLETFNHTILDVHWSRDDQWIYFSTGGSLHRVHVANGIVENHGELQSYTPNSKFYWLNEDYLLVIGGDQLSDYEMVVLDVRTSDVAIKHISDRYTDIEGWLWDDQNEWLYYQDSGYYNGQSGREQRLYRIHPDGTGEERIGADLISIEIIGLDLEAKALFFESYLPYAITRIDFDTDTLTTIYSGEEYVQRDCLLVYEGWIYCVNERNYMSDLVRINVDNGHVENLASIEAYEPVLEVTPDGQYIAVTTTQNGLWGVFSMRLDGSDQRFIKTGHEYGPPFFTPLFDLTWHWQRLLLVGVGLLSASVGLHAYRKRPYSPAGTKQS